MWIFVKRNNQFVYRFYCQLLIIIKKYYFTDFIDFLHAYYNYTDIKTQRKT